MTTPADLFSFYVSQHRGHSIPGFHGDLLPGFTRYTPLLEELEGIITFATLTPAEADAAITTQMAYFSKLGRSFEWKVHTLDQPADLAIRLRRHGFVAGETEAFMLYPLSGHHDVRQATGIQIRPIQSAGEIRALAELHENLSGAPLAWLAPSLTAAREELEIYGAYDGGTLVGTGWTDYPAHSAIANLHGGAVLPAYRGRGIYSELFAARAASAVARGVSWLAVDAAPMSRPILLRKGFRLICETTPFRMEYARNLSGRSTA